MVLGGEGSMESERDDGVFNGWVDGWLVVCMMDIEVKTYLRGMDQCARDN